MSACSICGGDLVPLGTLGAREHYRCRSCGAGFSVGRVELHVEQLVCLDHDAGAGPCRGAVEPRWPGYGSKHYPRCERHGEARIARDRENREKYLLPHLSDEEVTS